MPRKFANQNFKELIYSTTAIKNKTRNIYDKIMLESTGEFRKLKTPSIFLEDVFCNGEFHQNCDRSCFCFWREAWLERTE